jgi:protein-tyrosine-phosphatase
VRSLLFVCIANICRSAYAELVTAARAADRIDDLLSQVLPRLEGVLT